MISIYPTFYHTFQCKAHNCQYTCCQKWDVPIDDDTANFYNTLTTPLGEKLRHTMTADENGYSFVFPEDKPRCPLLTPNGLCQIILELGEDALSDVCRNHPRFYKYIEDLELCGVGLSCEAAVEGLLAHPNDNILFTIEEDNNKFNDIILITDNNERNTIDLITLHDIFHLLLLDIDDKILTYLASTTIAKWSRPDYEKLINIYAKTEAVDTNWLQETAKVHQYIYTNATLTNDVITYINDHNTSLNCIYQYIIYRQLDMLADYSLSAIIQYAMEATHFITLSSIVTGNLAESIRRWSEQIEYNEETIELLLSMYESN